MYISQISVTPMDRILGELNDIDIGVKRQTIHTIGVLQHDDLMPSHSSKATWQQKTAQYHEHTTYRRPSALLTAADGKMARHAITDAHEVTMPK